MELLKVPTSRDGLSTLEAAQVAPDNEPTACQDTDITESTVRAASRTVQLVHQTASSTNRVPVQFGPITASNVEMLRTVNVHIFPVRYNDSFYDDALFVPRGYAQFAYWDGLVVGAICCRHEPVDNLFACSRRRTYIMTLGVLEPYRHYKIGSALLQSVIRLSIGDDIDHIYLHVQTTNDGALRFYRHFGFEVRDTIHNYYKRLQPPDCFVLVKSLTSLAYS